MINRRVLRGDHGVAQRLNKVTLAISFVRISDFRISHFFNRR